MNAAPAVVSPPVAPLDVEAVRRDFPILRQQVHGKPLIYLDNGATVQKPEAVIEAEARFYREDYANVHRGVHTLAERATAAYHAARQTVQRALNAGDAREIVFVRGTTEAINLVAHSFVRPRVRPGDEILITELEHHANIVPWQLLCEQTGAVLKVAPIDERGQVDQAAYRDLLGPRTRMVAISHVSNALGTINPVREMIEAAHAAGAPVLVDGAQAVPHMAVDVRALGCEFYAFSGHKVYGPTGIGVLYGRGDLLDAMPPYQGGGDMIKRVRLEGTTYADIPYRFEAGTPNVAGAIGLAAALDYLARLGVERVAAHEQALLRHAHARLAEVPGLRIIGTAERKASLVSLVMEGAHAADIGTILDQEGIAVRAGHHCAMPAMDHFCVPATARASFAAYNTEAEIDALIAGLHKVRELVG